MPSTYRIAYLCHSFRSDWNNGNAHFLRGLLRALGALGHEVILFEPETEWSLNNLQTEPNGRASLQQFAETYSDLDIRTYPQDAAEPYWREALDDVNVVILHEWNPPQLAHLLLSLRTDLGFRLLFHDTHHRASSSPGEIERFGTDRFDGILAFGEVLATIYRERFGMQQVWTLHEAADTTVFKPLPLVERTTDVVWIGNWGDEERSAEIREYLLQPASQLSASHFVIYGVRYPQEGLAALAQAGVQYGGYLPNLQAPAQYAASRVTVHVPRRQYASAMKGIPTIRVFEALACGIPLVSAPWEDSEELFRKGDYLQVSSSDEMRETIAALLRDEALAVQQAKRGVETVLSRHTCMHRALQLTEIFEELLG